MNVGGAAHERSGAASTDDTAGASRVVVYTRTGCHLCDDACVVVSRVCGETGTSWTTVDVDASDDLRGVYGDYVPVVTVDGVQQGFWRIDEDRLRRLLAR
ncbi:glutaredoxin family protein [Sanguibacter sp. 25GB23B1]|uniref:glutaredoxin family protein n=1 Tax=unclassified Sanguibacter TaxID=2645534 RepID=UPI0032AFF2D0